MAVDYSEYKCIKVERDDKVLNLTLNRPEVLNAVNGQMHWELACIFAEVQEDDEANVVVLTGAGRGFCAGGDIKGMGDARGSGGNTMREGKKIVEDMLELDKPIIAAVNGPAVGLGATIALFCDIIVASDKARFGDPHVRVGLTAGDGGAVIWPLLVGVAKAKELLMTGDIIDANEAERIGLVNRVVPHDDLQSTVRDLAQRLANGPSYAIQSTKKSVNKTIKAVANLVLDTSLALEGLSFFTEDHREAVRAFVEKRAPQFKGR